MKKYFFLLLAFVIFYSCRKDALLTDSSAKLEFSDDTVIFDTVFTTIGSVTKQLKVYNKHNRALKISTIQIAGSNNSNFRMNVDGVPTKKAENIVLRANDSLYIFVEVTVNPNNLSNPLIITDSIVFETNGNIQDVDLAAWGQDANFYYYPVFGTYTLNNAKPHVIYGYAFVYPSSILTVDAGAKIYFHKNSGLIVLSDGTLKVNGTLESPVIFQGDRLEYSYNDVPGQWDMIWLSNIKEDFTSGPPSKNNEFNYAIIKNGNIGLRVDTNSDNFLTPTVKLNNTIIQNMSGAALLGEGAYIEAKNCLFANAGQYVAALVYGGKYQFTHCTFANYWKYEKRDNPLLLLNNYYEYNGTNILRSLEKADFENCIIYGANANEIELDKDDGTAFEYKFNYCVLKTDINTTDANRFINVIVNPDMVNINGELHDPVFNDALENDYHLFPQSEAVNNGNSILTGNLIKDLDGKYRDSQPDLGALEYVP